MVTQYTSLPALKARWRKENKKNEKERNTAGLIVCTATVWTCVRALERTWEKTKKSYIEIEDDVKETQHGE